jgi:hypothetical protein
MMVILDDRDGDICRSDMVALDFLNSQIISGEWEFLQLFFQNSLISPQIKESTQDHVPRDP